MAEISKPGVSPEDLALYMGLWPEGGRKFVHQAAEEEVVGFVKQGLVGSVLTCLQ